MTQIDVLEEYQLLLVLSYKTLLSYTLEILDPGDNQSQLARRPKKIQNHANFFKAGVCMGRHLVCSAKMSGISTTIKVFEPMETASRTRRRMFQSGQEALKPFKVSLLSEFMAPILNFLAGVLRTRRILIDRLPTIQTLRCLFPRVRSRKFRNPRNAAVARSSRYIAGFRQP